MLDLVLIKQTNNLLIQDTRQINQNAHKQFSQTIEPCVNCVLIHKPHERLQQL